MKRFLCIIFAAVLLLCGCDKPSYQKTPETEKALETYLSAVRQSVAQTSGSFRVNITCDDSVVQKKKTEECYTYNYTVNEDGSERFTYTALDSAGKVINEYKTNEAGEVIHVQTGEKTEDFNNYLKHSTNPISNMTLFRMDANFEFRHSIISDIKEEQTDNTTVISVTFEPKKLTALTIKNSNGLARTITAHERRYVIQNGKITEIFISDRENATYKGEKGTIETQAHVEVTY